MTDDLQIASGESFRVLLPGYYLPTDEERRDAFRRGLVSFDSNALLSLYRFSPAARRELLGVLSAVRPRLFIPHQVAEEFHRNRLGVVDDRLQFAVVENDAIAKLLRQVEERIRHVSKRYQIDAAHREALINSIADLSSNLREALEQASSYDLDREAVKMACDPVLLALDELLSGRIGQPLPYDDHVAAVKEAGRRRQARIAPGYMDEGKPNDVSRAGDYILWRQLIDEARVHVRPVLLVSDEVKEDWVRLGNRKEVLGPNTDLVLEMQQQAGVRLHKTTVLGLLADAPGYLGIQVSRSTLKEAEALPTQKSLQQTLTKDTAAFINKLPHPERVQFVDGINNVKDFISAGHEVLDHPGVRIVNGHRDTYLLRWSDQGRALFRVLKDNRGQPVHIEWTSVTFKKQ